MKNEDYDIIKDAIQSGDISGYDLIRACDSIGNGDYLAGSGHIALGNIHFINDHNLAVGLLEKSRSTYRTIYKKLRDENIITDDEVVK